MTLYRLERAIGKSLTLVGLANKDDETGEVLSIEYWVEIEKIKIPSSIGFCRTEAQFRKEILKKAKSLGENLIVDFLPLVTEHYK